MKLFKIISFIFIGTLFLSFKPLTNPVFIKGQVKRNPKENSGYVEYVAVFVKGGNKVLAKTVTDDKGNFELSFTPEKENSFDFFCNAVGIDTMLLASIKAFESDTAEMTFFIPREPKRNKLGRVVCPKCNRPDMVYKIVYGDNPIVVRHISNSGDTTYSPLYKGTYQESCTVQPARYYCDRDKVKF
jgi:hypothetical protein